ncbi:diguanylate cyclase [Marinobacter sp. X15-166B]|nr:diguanylate cyclase [Marinobacter sp. X15-166B]
MPLLILVGFITIAIGLKSGLERQESFRVRAALDYEAQRLAANLEREFDTHVKALQRMAQRMAENPGLTEPLWRYDARSYLVDFGNYQALEWVDEALFIRWVEPLDGNADALGFNVGFTPARRAALLDAAANGTVDISGVIELQQGGSGMVLYAPVASGRQNRGFIAGVFRMDTLASTLLTPRVRQHFDIDIVENGRLAYQLSQAHPLHPDFTHTETVELPAVDWALTLKPNTAWVETQYSNWPGYTYITMILMGALASALIWLAQTVLQRNRALSNARARLSQETRQREGVQQTLARLESTDALTGLANRRFFMADVAHALTIAARLEHQLALVMIDLDRFQTLNDTLGHQLGDELLVKVAQRLDTLSDERVLIAYSGGDEFMVCQQHVTSLDDVIWLLGQLQRCFRDPFLLHGERYSITATLGAAVYPHSGLDADLLLRNADIALYRAKNNGRNTYQFYTEGMQERELQRLALQKEFADALVREEFVLFFQPQLDLRTGTISSVEALVRWQHPKRGLLVPDEFISLAVESGQITALGRWVIKAACQQLAHWRTGPYRDLIIAVNLSGRELDDHELVDYIQHTLTHHRIDANRLEVELTEEHFIRNIERNKNQLTRLRDIGVKLAIDDFGVGYSSLGYLRDFPVDLIKIDRSFITNVTQQHDDAIITRAVINLGHNLGLKVVAEGIETIEQLQFLQQHHCDCAQGYFISRPIPAHALDTALQQSYADLLHLEPV